jgi:hypothetical protein
VADTYICENWVDPEDTTFVKKHILARGAYLILTPASAITCALDTIVGLGYGFECICSRGKSIRLYTYTSQYLPAANSLLSLPYLNFLRAFNPEAKVTKDAKISCEGIGFITNFTAMPLRNLGRTCHSSSNVFKKHICSRIIYVLLVPTILITRVADGIISVPATFVSLVLLGKVHSMNNLSFRSLQSTGIIQDLFFCTVKFMNPGIVSDKKLLD